MILSEVRDILDAIVLTGEEFLSRQVISACGSDLLSDVLATVGSKSLLLTGLTNIQVIRTAEILDVIAIVFVRGKCPGDEVLKLAKEKDLVIMKTKLNLYEACGKLYLNGLR